MLNGRCLPGSIILRLCSQIKESTSLNTETNYKVKYHIPPIGLFEKRLEAQNSSSPEKSENGSYLIESQHIRCYIRWFKTTPMDLYDLLITGRAFSRTSALGKASYSFGHRDRANHLRPVTWVRNIYKNLLRLAFPPWIGND